MKNQEIKAVLRFRKRNTENVKERKGKRNVTRLEARAVTRRDLWRTCEINVPPGFYLLCGPLFEDTPLPRDVSCYAAQSTCGSPFPFDLLPLPWSSARRRRKIRKTRDPHLVQRKQGALPRDLKTRQQKWVRVSRTHHPSI